MLLTLAQGYFPALRSRKGVIELIVEGGGIPIPCYSKLSKISSSQILTNN